MGNDLSKMASVGRSLTLIVSFLLLFVNAFAAPPLNASPPTSLCVADEIVLFSCNIGDKKLSLCGTTDGVNSPLLVQYRFGQSGGTPELEYPSKASEPLSAFEFGTMDNTSGFPLQTISFNRPGATYDIMTHDSRQKRLRTVGTVHWGWRDHPGKNDQTIEMRERHHKR